MGHSKSNFMQLREVEGDYFRGDTPISQSYPRPEPPEKVIGYEVGLKIFKFQSLAFYEDIEDAKAHVNSVRDSYEKGDARRFYTIMRPVFEA